MSITQQALIAAEPAEVYALTAEAGGTRLVIVITPRGDRVAALTRFESHTLRPFGLPRVLPGDDRR
jgi:hypothetical protein